MNGYELMVTVFWSCWTRWRTGRGGPFFWMRRMRSRIWREAEIKQHSGPFGRPIAHGTLGGTIAGLTGTCTVGALDYLAGPEVSLFPLYLLVIVLAAWFLGNKHGTVILVTCILTWILVECRQGVLGDSPLLLMWKLVVHPAFFVIFQHTLWKFRERLEREHHRARRDPLTGLVNRYGFCEISEVELARARRHGHPLSVAYLDIDHFKELNDSRGHAAGDSVLRQVGQTLGNHLRVTDLPARLGGDEYAILLPETDAGAAQRIMQKVASLLLSAMRQGGWPVTFSVGVATFIHPPTSVEGMLKIADRSMYQVKRAGKNNLKVETVSAA